MSEYGYIPEAPEQSFANNKGIFTPNDIYDLAREDKWTSVGDLELIQTQVLNDSSYSTISLAFENLGDYNLHLVTWSNVRNNGYFPLGIQVKTGGSYITSNSYKYAMQQFSDNATFTQTKSTGDYSIKVGISAYQGCSGYAYIYNAVDSSRGTYVTSHSTQARGNLLGSNGMFGAGTYATASEVQGFRFVYEGTSHAMGGFGIYSLYGVSEG